MRHRREGLIAHCISLMDCFLSRSPRMALPKKVRERYVISRKAEKVPVLHYLVVAAAAIVKRSFAVIE